MSRLRTPSSAALVLVVATVLLALATRWSVVQRADQWLVDQATRPTRAIEPLHRVLDGWAWLALPSHCYLVAALLVVAKLRWTAWKPLLVMAIGWLVATAAKPLVARPRPLHALDHLSGWSFPSGHAMNMTVAALTVVSAYARGRAIAAVLIALTCLDRVFLGVHFPTDVIGGVLLGAAVVLAAAPAWAPPRRRPDQTRA